MHRDASESAIPDRPSPPRNGVSVRTIAPEALDARLIAAWRNLGERALEPNAYLTPMFVVPALIHLGSAMPVKIFFMETAQGELIGAGVFNTKPLLPFFSWQALVGFRSKHSFLTGLLLDRDQASRAVDAFFSLVSQPGTDWHGVRFDWLDVDNPQGHLLLDAARRHHIWWSESERMRRALLLPGRADAGALAHRIPSSRRKDLRRRLRRLSESGTLDWCIHAGKELTDDVVERFLALEHMGWKGQAGTSVRANAAHERFFTAIIAGFREADGVFFTELLHDGRVIASTCNLLSGNSAFTFKLGWDPAYARYSPGMINEWCLLERANEFFGHLDLIDSGAVEDSFIDTLWRDKRPLVSGVFATTTTGKLLFAMAAIRRRVRHGLASLQRSLDNAWRGAWRQLAAMRPMLRQAGKPQSLQRCS